MGLQTKPAYIGVSGFQNTVENDRNFIENCFGRTGVLRYGNFDISAVAGVMQAQVQAGGAVILGGASTQGGYFGFSDAAENLAWPAANGSNPRYDTLIMRVIDTQYGASAAGDQLRWEILQGTAAGSPVPLTDSQINTNFPQPGAWMRMYDVLVPTGVTNLTTATFNRKFPYTNTTGLLLYNSAVESKPTGLYRGEQLMDTATRFRYEWDGTQWRYLPGQIVYSMSNKTNAQFASNVTGTGVVFYTAPNLTGLEQNQALEVDWCFALQPGGFTGGPHHAYSVLQYSTDGGTVWNDYSRSGWISMHTFSGTHFALDMHGVVYGAGAFTQVRFRLKVEHSNTTQAYDVGSNAMQSHFTVLTMGKMTSEIATS